MTSKGNRQEELQKAMDTEFLQKLGDNSKSKTVSADDNMALPLLMSIINSIPKMGWPIRE